MYMYNPNIVFFVLKYEKILKKKTCVFSTLRELVLSLTSDNLDRPTVELIIEDLLS